MDTEPSRKQYLEFSRELCYWVVGGNIIFCKILRIFSILRSLPNSAKNSVIAESQNPGGTFYASMGCFRNIFWGFL